MEQAGRHAVEKIKDGADDDKYQSHLGVVHKGIADGDAARNEIAASDGVGNMFLDAHCCWI